MPPAVAQFRNETGVSKEIPMKLRYLALSLATAMSLSTLIQTAQAQGYNPNSLPQGLIQSAFSQRYNEISAQINNATAMGQLSPAQASSLMSGLNQISTHWSQAFATVVSATIRAPPW